MRGGKRPSGGKRMVKAVVFDMDGVMYDTERLSHKSWLEVCREMGCTIKEEDLLSFRGRPREMNEQQYAHFEGTNGVSYKVLRKGRDRRMQQYFALHGIPVKPGLYELMDFLKKNGIRTGVATGTARDIAEEYWKKTDVRQYLDFTICGQEAGRGKPEPDVYLRAASMAGVKPEECMIIEDSPNGIRAGFAAGCITVMVPDIDEPDEGLKRLCRYVCRSLKDIPEIIRELNS